MHIAEGMDMHKSKRQYECRTSLVFFNNENLYYVIDTGFLVEVNNKNDRGFEQALKLHFSKRKIDIFQYVESDKIDCAFCNTHNLTWYPTYEINEKREIKITGVKYRKPIHFCYSAYTNKCDGKKLNPNSAAFVKATKKIDNTDEALKFIRSRNQSPFYRENHESLEAYQKFQASLFYGRDISLVRSSLKKAEATKLSNFNNDISKKKKTAFSYISETPDGKLLNSNGERHFYSLLCKHGIDQYVETNGFYHGSIFMYDFYFPLISLYVEIAGMDYKKYNDRIKQKSEEFGSLIIDSRRDFKKFEQTVITIKEKIICKQHMTSTLV